MKHTKSAIFFQEEHNSRTFWKRLYRSFSSFNFVLLEVWCGVYIRTKWMKRMMLVKSFYFCKEIIDTGQHAVFSFPLPSIALWILLPKLSNLIRTSKVNADCLYFLQKVTLFQLAKGFIISPQMRAIYQIWRHGVHRISLVYCQNECICCRAYRRSSGSKHNNSIIEWICREQYACMVLMKFLNEGLLIMYL